MKMSVPFYKHQLGPIEQQAIFESLNNEILTSGSICKDVENQLAEFFDIKHVKLVNSWTNGAVATLLALGIKPGDEVIVPSMTFIATANVVELVGATPIFCDVNPETLLMTYEDFKHLITPRTKAILLVHLYGQMCDTKAIKNALKGRDIRIIEDSAHSFESEFDGVKPGAHSDAAIFSFYATKNVTTGEGGAIITNDTDLYEQILQTVLHGMSAGAAQRYELGKYKHWGMERLGTKANLPDILAALLPSQISKVSEKLLIRNELSEKYDSVFQDEFIKRPRLVTNCKTAHHLYPLWINPKFRDELISELGSHRIGVTVNFRPVHQMGYYQAKYNQKDEQFPNSTSWGGGVFCLPLYPGLTWDEQEYVIKTMKEEIFPKFFKRGLA